MISGDFDYLVNSLPVPVFWIVNVKFDYVFPIFRSLVRDNKIGNLISYFALKLAYTLNVVFCFKLVNDALDADV